MAETLYVSFADPSQAEKATGALLDYGLKNEDISLVSNREGLAEAGAKGGMITETMTPGGERIGGSAYESYGGATVRAAPPGDAEPRPAVSGLAATASAYGTSVPGDIPMTEAEADRDDAGNPVKTAEWGISSTTGADAGAGAVKGAGYGLAAGIIAGLASMVVPPFGIVLGGGALATAIGGAAGATVAGAVAGGATGYMKDQGVDEEYVEKYDHAIQGGGAVLAIHLPSGQVDDALARELLGKYGAENISTAAPRM